MDPRLADLADLHRVRHVDRIVNLDLLAAVELDLVNDRRRGRDQIQIELAREPLLDDLQMQEPEEAAAEAEAEGRRGLHLVGEARIVEAELGDGGAQVLEIGGIDRKQAAEHHRLRRAKSRQRRCSRLAIVRDGVADARVGDLLDRGIDEADLARPELAGLAQLGREDADPLDLVGRVRAHHADALVLAQGAVDHAHEHHHAEISVVPAVDQKRLQRGLAIALGWRQAMHDRLQHLRHVLPGLGRDQDRVRRIDADHVLDLLLDLLGLGGRQVDLVEHRHDLMAVVDGLVDIGERLRFHAL